MKRVKPKDLIEGCLELVGEILFELIFLAIGFVAIMLLSAIGINVDTDSMDGEMVSVIGFFVLIAIAFLIAFAVIAIKKIKAKSQNGKVPCKATKYINKKGKNMYRIGIDLGGTNIAAAIVNEEFKIVKKKSVPTGAERETKYIMDDMAELCRSVCADAGISFEEIDAIGIASPGVANHTDGIIEYANNLPFRRFEICRELGERLGMSNIHVENDANAAAWGEAIAGAARGTRNSVMITLGTGVGGGVIIDGKVFSGFNYAGTELGHVVIEKGGRPCSCGRRGCWEAYSSATALIKMTAEKLAECEKQGRATLMTELVAQKGKVSGTTAFKAHALGDEAAREVIDMYIGYLITGLVNMINIFQPEVLSIGGGISGEGQKLIDMMIDQIKKEQYGTDFVENTRVCIAELGNDAGIIGAAFLGI